MFTKKDRLVNLPLGLIHPNSYQARVEFDSTALEKLAESIKRNGLLQPISVRKRGDGAYELIAGERRLRAARLAGLKNIPCIIKHAEGKKSAILGLVENLQREDLNMFEQAEGIRKLIDEWGMSQYDCAIKLGKAQSTISNKLRLLRFTKAEQIQILSAGLSERHVRALLRIDNPVKREEMLNKIIKEKMSVTQTEEAVDKLFINPTPTVYLRTAVINDIRVYLNTLTKTVENIRKSGLDAHSNEVETDDYIEYTVILPKRKY
ncbi:MAG: ParB/RepB/Spo0J family partition protein [Acutalibacteraceae bacterium]|nr:ParB/RepB/Spo0J family partition protein [Acutalibacteraceae bacterium]